MKAPKVEELQITNVSYVHEPDAMKRWINLYIEMFKDVLEREMEKAYPDQHTLE